MKALTAGEYRALRAVECGRVVVAVSPSLERRGYVRGGEMATCPFCGGKHPLGYVVTALGKLAMRCYELLHRAVD